MKKTLTNNQLAQTYSFRVFKQGDTGIAPIAALCALDLNALASNRSKTIRNKIESYTKPYFETINQKKQEKEKLCIELTEKHSKRIESLKALPDKDVDYDEINRTFQKDLFAIESRINKELEQLGNDEYEIEFHPIKMSDFMIDPEGSIDDPKNWHIFKGDHFDFLDWFIIQDVDQSDDTETSAEEIEGLDDAVTEAVDKI